MSPNVKSYLIDENFTIKQTMRRMSEIGEKELFIVDAQLQLKGAVSDGDIRKWILKGGLLDDPVSGAFNRSPQSVKKGYRIKNVKQIMLDKKIESVPVLDDNGVVQEVLIWDAVFAGKVDKYKPKLNIPVIIMSGGRGTRLDPFTRILPKALIPIDGKPIIEVIMDKFNAYDIKDFFITVNHKARMIKSYFEEMNQKYRITYIEEDKPLGTAGSLKFLEKKLKDPFLVTNCDVIIDSDYGDIINFHTEHKYDLTVVVSCRHYVIPYGVCEIEGGGLLKSIKEKPEYDLLVNTGMYVMNNRILSLVPKNKFFNMTDLISVAKEKNFKIGVFPINEKSWMDIGQWEEYYKAIKDVSANFQDQ